MFDVRLNGHVVVKDLDIFERVGHSTAHDEIVSFSIRRGKLSVQGEVSTFNGKLTVEFVKVSCLCNVVSKCFTSSLFPFHLPSPAVCLFFLPALISSLIQFITPLMLSNLINTLS